VISAASSVPEEQQRAAITSLLYKQRAQTALLFRRLFSAAPADSGLRCVDLCDQLLEYLHDRAPHLGIGIATSLSLPLSQAEKQHERLHQPLDRGVVWRLVCDMAGLGYSKDQESARIRFADVAAFLERAQGEAEKDAMGVTASTSSLASKQTTQATQTQQPSSAQLDFSLKKKLFESKDVRGERLRLLALSPPLRQRLRHSRVFANTGIDVDGPVTAAELGQLVESIDLPLSAAECRYVLMHCGVSSQGLNVDENPGLEGAAPLHLVILFLSRYLI